MRIKYRRKLRIEKIQEKENRDMLEINEVVRISNFLRINSQKMFEKALNTIIAKKTWKRVRS